MKMYIICALALMIVFTCMGIPLWLDYRADKKDKRNKRNKK